MNRRLIKQMSVVCQNAWGNRKRTKKMILVKLFLTMWTKEKYSRIFLCALWAWDCLSMGLPNSRKKKISLEEKWQIICPFQNYMHINLCPWLMYSLLRLTTHSSLAMHSLDHFNGLVQERGNSSALALELRLSCINPSIYGSGDGLSFLGTKPLPEPILDQYLDTL